MRTRGFWVSVRRYVRPAGFARVRGPIVLLVGNGTLSAAEHFSLALVDANRVTVVGRGTAGTDGNITGVQLPGQFALSFTGMVLSTPRWVAW
ncbi:S41 family peptidase [Sorangium sp. So ce1153]|uniref:S41 family peptidase n=1 Tax=Sorangium sp. So ce1153 TaxID=3133333 RepID=UPI003F625408